MSHEIGLVNAKPVTKMSHQFGLVYTKTIMKVAFHVRACKVDTTVIRVA